MAITFMSPIETTSKFMYPVFWKNVNKTNYLLQCAAQPLTQEEWVKKKKIANPQVIEKSHSPIFSVSQNFEPS